MSSLDLPPAFQPVRRNRDWLAALLLRRPERFMPRFAATLARLTALPRGYRMRLQRKAAMTVAGAALVLAMAGSSLLVPTVHASTITVNETTCTLTDAIRAANRDMAIFGCVSGSPGLDTIDLQADVLLTYSIVGSHYGAGVGLPGVTSEIVIEGNGHTIERNRADNDEFRILVVSRTGDLTLNDVTISGGYLHSGSGPGAGVYVFEGTLAINDSTFSSNNGAFFDYSGGSGGGVHNENGTVTISNSLFSGHRSTVRGSAVSQYGGTTTISNSLFSDNWSYRHGGAIGQERGTMTITNSTIRGSSALDEGGGISNGFYGEMTITNSTISGGGGPNGGGIFNGRFGEMTITNSTISGNHGRLGSGIFSRGEMTITNSTISGNDGSRGGGIFNGDDGEMTITNSTISDNHAGAHGGGVYSSGSTRITNSTVTDNRASNKGGGLFNRFGIALVLERSLISGNSARDRGDEVYDRNTGMGVTTANDHNLFGHDGLANADAFYNFTPGASDIVATSDGTAPTALAGILNTTLDGNGGSTETHLLVTGSPALDAVPSVDCVAPRPTNGVDQRGEARNQDSGGGVTNDECDIGAVEGTVSTAIIVRYFVSAIGAGTTVDGLDFSIEDIIQRDGFKWSIYFDGSDAGLKPDGNARHNINAFWIPDTQNENVVMSFAQNARVVPGITPKVDGMDLVSWDGKAFSLYFDGSDVGLTNLTAERIDGLHILPGSKSPIGSNCAAYLLVSTQGSGKVPNFGGGTLSFKGEDVLGFCQTKIGESTAGFWHMVLDGSKQGMPANSTDSISMSADGTTLYLTTKGQFKVDNAVGGHSMVYEYDMITEEFSGPIFDAKANGLPKKVDGLQVD